jgi:hypothetical protein
MSVVHDVDCGEAQRARVEEKISEIACCRVIFSPPDPMVVYVEDRKLAGSMSADGMELGARAAVAEWVCEAGYRGPLVVMPLSAWESAAARIERGYREMNFLRRALITLGEGDAAESVLDALAKVYKVAIPEPGLSAKPASELPAEVMRRRNVSASAKVVYALLRTMADHGDSWPTLAAIQARAGIAKATAVRVVRELSDSGLVVRAGDRIVLGDDS